MTARNLVATFLVLAGLFASCEKGGSPGLYPQGAFDFVAPSGAGGGWDLTIRTVAKVLRDTRIVHVPMPVRNSPGAGGAVHLAQLQQKKGSGNIITVYSPPLLLTQLTGTSDYGYRDVTPLARLIADYAVFVVARDSPYRSLVDVMRALKEDVKSVKIGGNSSAGSMDHLQFLIMARAAGIPNIRDIDYVSFDDSGAAMILGGHIDLFSTGLSEFRALIAEGELRALAQTADHRIGTGLISQIPTCREQGIEATFVNWRGLFGPPGMPAEAVEYWRNALKRLSQAPEWDQACKMNLWEPAYLDAPQFREFLESANQEYKSILAEIGMLRPEDQGHGSE